jgi:AcrR family transcriptional regulator
MSEPAAAPKRQGRWRTGEQSRQRVLDAALARFTELGYDRATVRAIAADAGVDPGMVHYFFGSKQNLFAAVMRLPGDLHAGMDALLAGGIDDLGPRLVRRFLAIWDGAQDFEPLLALVRSAPTSEESTRLLREFILREITDRVAEVLDEAGPLRMGLVTAHLIGLASARYLVRVEAVSSADPEVLVAWFGPIVQQALTGPLA